MRKKFVLFLFIFCLTIGMLSACSVVPVEVDTHEPAVSAGDSFGRFVIIESEFCEDANTYQYTMYDSETYVMYVYIGSKISGGITQLVNTDGSPMLYYDAIPAVG